MKLQLQKPLKVMVYTQHFGKSNPIYSGQKMQGHNGIDLVTAHGTPVYAAHDGRAYYQIDNGGGHGVVLITDKEYDDEKGGQCYYKTIYWHLVDPIKEPSYKSPIQDFPWGKDVKTGDVIGYADNTGISTGDHLHFGLKPVALVGESQNSYYNLEQNNGYFGAIDPDPFFFDYVPKAPQFTRDLPFGVVHPDVKRLQKYLNSKGFTVARTGAGSVGKETEFFGVLTKVALSQFQKTNGITPAVGYFGPITRDYINKNK